MDNVEEILSQYLHDVDDAYMDADIKDARAKAIAAINAHYAQKMGRWLGKDEELDESDGVYSEEYHAWTDGRNSLRSEVRAKAKEEGIDYNSN